MSFTMPNTIVNGASRDARPVQANFAAITAALQNDFVLADGTVAMTGPLTLAADPSAPTQAATRQYVDNSLPPGSIVDYVGDTAPNAFWAVSIGQLVNKSDYPILWTVCQNKFGTSTLTQFYLPDLRSVFVAGKGAAAWSDVIGETGGSKDSIVVSHGHTSSASVSGSVTGGGTHGHTYTKSYGQAGSQAILGVGAPWHLFETSDNVGGNGSHSHGWSGSASVTVNPDGVSGTNKNLPPYIVLNKIIRLG